MDADSCSSLFCGRGRECQTSEKGHPECVCVRKCRRHHKLICGTDGVLYSSHCELHRAACLSKQPIAIDHTYLCLRRRGTVYTLYTEFICHVYLQIAQGQRNRIDSIRLVFLNYAPFRLCITTRFSYTSGRYFKR